LAGEGRWSSYRDYTFSVNSDDILRSDGNKAREIADYMNQNPSSRIAIDGSNQRRVGNVRAALIDAPACRLTRSRRGHSATRSSGVTAASQC
jgi:hypothetical protein